MTSPARMQWRRQTVVDFNLVVDRHATKLRAAWTDLDTIVAVLNDVATDAPHNHMFFPLSGGLSLRRANRSREDGCIELETDGDAIAVARPASLQLERFSNDLAGDWTYLRLNLAPLSPSQSNQPHPESYSEELTELEPGRAPLERPDSLPNVRVITRLFRGALVLFAKGSRYNHLAGVYDGTHSLGLLRKHGHEVTPELFRAAIKDGIAAP